VLTLRDLEQFVVLAEELNFRLAAERLHVSQPTLSQTLQRLERYLGSTLIERTTRSSHLSEAGWALLEGAELLLADARSLEGEVRDVGRGMHRELRVGAVNPAMRALVPRTLRAVHAAFPDVRIKLQPMSSFALVRSLREGRIKLAIVRTVEPVVGFVAVPLMKDPLFALLPAEHPLARREQVRLRDLSGEAFVMAPRARNPDFHDELVSLYRRRGCSPGSIIEVSGLHSQLALIGAGMGIAVQSVLYLDPGREDVAFVPVGDRLSIPLQLLVPEGDDSDLIRCFVQAARRACRELEDEAGESIRLDKGETGAS
jgi:DNA-binding transcriptional LysR family regulator